MVEPSHASNTSGLTAEHSALRDPAVLQLHALYAAGRVLARAEHAAHVERALLDAARAATGCAAAALYVMPDEPELHTALKLVGVAGGDDAPPDLLLLDGAWLAQLRAARHVSGGQRLTWQPATHAALELVAVAGEAGLHAVLVLAWPDAARQAGWEQAALALAEDAGFALDRCARRQATAAAHVERTQQLLGAVHAINESGLLYGTLDDRLLGAMLGQILVVLRLGGGAIYLYDEPAERVELELWARGPESSYGHDPAVLWEPPLLESTLEHARETVRRSLPAHTVSAAEPDAASAEPLALALRELGAAQLVSVPLLAGGWLTGVLQVVAAPGRAVGEEQVQLLSVLARQAAVVIENARLFAQTRADRERTRAVVDASNDAILMLDEHRRPMIVNRRARFFFGLTERDLVGKSFDQIGSLFTRIFEDGQRFHGWLGQLLRTQGERAVEEFHILSPEPRLLQCYSAPVLDPHDRYLGRLLVFRDITREREVERMKNDFVATVSHELRTPLTSIQGALQLVLGPPGGERPGIAAALPPRGLELLGISLNNTERLIRMINDILDIARIEQGRIQLRREQLSPEELCLSGAAEMSAFANGRGRSVEVRVSPWLPKVLADKDRSVQILVNLLSNAIKFSLPGQRVVLSARRDGQLVAFAVQDWGRGIALEQQSRLFQKFQQIDSSTTREVGGSGLGLAISKALVEEQGGRIWLESRPGEGSTFSFTLPLVPGTERSGTPRIFVLEHEDRVRDALCDAFLADGWEPQPASDVAVLEQLINTMEADMVLLGPALSAQHAALLRQLRAKAATAQLPVLLLSDAPPADLPRGVDALARQSDPATVVARAAQLRAERRPRVLVVDDDPHVRPVLVRLLQRHGLRVSNVGDGYSALAAADTQRPDLILLDVQMPGLDGFEVLRRLKASPETAHIPVIILTANDLSEAARSHGYTLGVQAYLEKPVSYERLISTVDTALGVSEGML